MATIGEALLTPEAGWKRYDGTHSLFTYKGSGWSSAAHVGTHGGSYYLSMSQGDTVEFVFVGTMLRLIGFGFTNRSTSIEVDIDGVKETFSQNVPYALAQMLDYEKTDLPYGEHKVVITNNQSAAYIIDAIDIDDTGYLAPSIGSSLTAPEPGWKRYEDTDPLFVYEGTWNTNTGTNYSGNSNKYGDNVAINVSFYGTKFRFIGYQGPGQTSENIKVYLNGELHGVFSQRSDTSSYSVLNYEILNLPLGKHNIRIETEERVAIDAIDIDDIGYLMASIGNVLTIPEPGWKRYEHTDSSISRSASWTEGASDAGVSAGSYLYSDADYANVTFSFVGSKIRLISRINTTYTDDMRISIDGVEESYSIKGAEANQVLVYEKTGLTYGRHEVRITARLNKTAGNNFGSFDAVEIDSDGALATIATGQVLALPESGWKRYEENNPQFSFTNDWSDETNVAHSNGSTKYHLYTNVIGKSLLKFKFKGTRIRIIGSNGVNRSSEIEIKIDGNSETFSQKESAFKGATLNYEKTDLEEGIHEVEISRISNGSIGFDSIDINDTGRLLHPDEVVSIEDLNSIGQRIRCHYEASSGVVGVFSKLGEETSEFIPVTSAAAPNGDFYFIKVDKGLLIADRVVQHSITWSALNDKGYIEGTPALSGMIIRSLTGGVAYADTNGNRSLAVQNYGGWPLNNEWDKYIINLPSRLGGYTPDSLFNAKTPLVSTICQETPVNNLERWTTTKGNNTHRIIRGPFKIGSTLYGEHENFAGFHANSSSYDSLGFRPVLEYKEV